ncbi:MAG: hypothetical protein JJU37_06530 [Balneolaceae bacterium]|nr:hypothetical protein [Balneolaceae bacterium]
MIRTFSTHPSKPLKLSKLDERQIRVIKCRFLGGMLLDESAVALGISN